MTELETATADKYTANPNKSQTLTDSVTGKTISEIGMAWAPELRGCRTSMICNDDGQLNGSDKDNPKNQQGGAFVVYWSVSAKYDGENSQPGKKVTHVLWAATKDFTNETYMFGGVFVPNSKYNRGNTIDTTMLQNGSRTSPHHRFRRDLHGIHRSCRLVACQRPGPVRDRPGQGLGVAPDQHRTHAPAARKEGVQRFQGQRTKTSVHVRRQLWICRLRCPLRLQPTRSRQLDSENPWSVLKADDYFLTANTKHGGVVSLTKAQYDAIRAADAKLPTTPT